MAAVAPGDAVMLNVPGQIANCLYPAIEAGRPYAVHVISDSRDTFAPGAFEHPLRPFFRWWFAKNLARQVAASSAALFVTRRTLQARYPSRGLVAGISDVDLPPAAFVAEPRENRAPGAPFTLMNIGTMSTQFTKGLDVLIDAVALCAAKGLNVRAVLVGGGRYQKFFEERAKELGVAERIVFRGQLPAGEAIRSELDAADLFVFPSRIEGLPRALVEAMARGLPCLSTAVGGIPELLSDDDLTPVGDAAALAEKIIAVAHDSERLAVMSARNLRSAREFRAEALQVEWNSFFRTLAEQTREWNVAHGIPDRDSMQKTITREVVVGV
ncbi:MAG: glycosyltransferase [Pirellulales bacterium]